jgi:hypothetical protein
MSCKDRILTPTHERILRAMRVYHLMTVDQVCRLLFAYPSSMSYTREHLQYLADNGYLERIPLLHAHPGNPTNVFTLAKAGINFLAEIGITSVHPGQRSRRSEKKAYKYLFIAHTLAINEVLITVAKGQDYTVERMLHDQELKRTPDNVVDANGDSQRVVPDAWVDLRQGKDQVCLSFEIDRGTEEQKVWRDKVRALVAWGYGPYVERFGTTSVTFAVVSVVGEKRMADLRHWTELELGAIKHQADGDLFMFTAEDAKTNPDAFLYGPVWQQPFTSRTVALIDRNVRLGLLVGRAAIGWR